MDKALWNLLSEKEKKKYEKTKRGKNFLSIVTREAKQCVN